jgi:hypothetical protein
LPDIESQVRRIEKADRYQILDRTRSIEISAMDAIAPNISPIDLSGCEVESDTTWSRSVVEDLSWSTVNGQAVERPL